MGNKKIEDNTAEENPLASINTSNDLVRYERNNFDKVVFRKNKTFWAGCDNTVWFLEKMYSIENRERKVRYDEGLQKLVRSVAFHVDDFPAIRSQLIEEKLKVVYESEKIVALALPKPVPVDRLKGWEREEKSIIKDVEAMLFPDRMHERSVVKHFIDLGVHISQCIQRDMPKEIRDTLGRGLLDKQASLLSLYSDLEIMKLTPAEKTEIAGKFIREAQVLTTWFMMAFNTGALNNKRAAQLGHSMHAIILAVNKKYLLKPKSKKTKSAKDSKSAAE